MFALVRKHFAKHITPRFVDIWVLSHLALSIASVIFVTYVPVAWLCYLVAAYGTARVFEIVIYQANVLLFDEYRPNVIDYKLQSYRRMIIMLLQNYAEIIFWLATTYVMMSDDIGHIWMEDANPAFRSIYSSFITMTTFGNFNLEPKTHFGAFVILFHSTAGLFMTLLSLARFVSLLPNPKSMDPREDR